ncbi:hypothetical protein [Streptomyces sp. A 4/2]|uniref:hypothetical protein n=1 Tax=Streptomyces sp. A 4/2 TaxID=2934314 RepID=UPI00202594CC|nr:hypothetical protein [Streptomyces sp. A 4/2]
MNDEQTALPEPSDSPEPLSLPEASEHPEAPEVPKPPVQRSRAFRIAAAVLPVVLVLGVAGGGIAYSASTADKADKKAPTRSWGDDPRGPGKDPVTRSAEGRHDTDLSKMLLPATGEYRLGPDIGAYGNDAELTAKQAEAMLKAGGKGLSGTRRRDWNERVEKLGAKGQAMRSYANDSGDLVIEVQISRMTDKKAVRNAYTFRTELFKAMEVFEAGPKVEGHRNTANCFLPPKEKRSGLDEMMCTAYEGEFLISFDAYGVQPFPRKIVAALLEKQIDYVKSPGESV